jgi:hypothetical protein
MRTALELADSMAVWDEEQWKEFEGGVTRLRRNRTAMQKLAEAARYAGVRPVFWISLAMVVSRLLF